VKDLSISSERDRSPNVNPRGATSAAEPGAAKPGAATPGAAKRRYQLQRRAELQAATRARIVAAAVELHTTVGPAATTISAIAKRAGVQRVTVYRHFPTLESLFFACTARGAELWPPPDPEAWHQIASPEARLRRALADVYRYYRLLGHGLEVILRDAPRVPVVSELLSRRQQKMIDAVAGAWRVRGRRKRLLLAVVGHALEFATWQSLTARGGLSDGEAIALMAQLILSAAGPDATR